MDGGTTQTKPGFYQGAVFNSCILSPTGDIEIRESTFNSIRGDMHTHFSTNEPGIHLLFQAIAEDAMHNSDDRYPTPNCHPRTRLQVLDIIEEWIKDPDPECRVFWMYGSAGAGKSAIVQKIAELLYGINNLVAATFFFGRGKGKRELGRYLFPTMAYQLSMNMVDLRGYIDAAMRRDPTLPTRTLDQQLQHLIVAPFQGLEDHSRHTRTILIDGLDECQDEKMQELIVNLIGKVVSEHKLPLQFLVASRPEPHIRETFDQPKLRRVTRRVVLDDKFKPSQDIEKYLVDGFMDICVRKSHLMKDVPRPWPTSGVIDLLVQKASGQFIYASTVLKFVDNRYSRPTKQLSILLDPKLQSRAFSDLDLLYSQILSTCTDEYPLLRVLGVIVVLQEPQPIIVIEELLGMDHGDVHFAILQRLYALVNGLENQTSGSIRFSHTSFRDYLIDENRSGKYFVNQVKAHAEIAVRVFCHTTDFIKSRWQMKTAYQEKEVPFCAPTEEYLVHHGYRHLLMADEEAFAAISDDADDLQGTFESGSIDHLAPTYPLGAFYFILDIFDNRGAAWSPSPQLSSMQRIETIYQNILYSTLEAVSAAPNSLSQLLGIVPVFCTQKKYLHLHVLHGLPDAIKGAISDLVEHNQRFFDRKSYRERAPVESSEAWTCLQRRWVYRDLVG